jgi:hypothetical protein
MCCIHTVGVYANNLVEMPNDRLQNCIKVKKNEMNLETGEIEFRGIINPNKWEDRFIYTYDDFQRVLNEIMQELGLTEYHFSRIDFALDYFKDSYTELYKIHKCICLLLSIEYKLENRYESIDPLLLHKLTIRAQSEYFEFENYNKDIESNHQSNVFNRLEFRSKALRKVHKDIPTLLSDWIKRLDKLPDVYERLQKRCNLALIHMWNSANGVEVKGLPEFTRRYGNNIFSKYQLLDLYSKIGIENPESRVKNFKRYNSIEFISVTDLKVYIEKLKQAMAEYLDGSKKGVIIAPNRITAKVHDDLQYICFSPLLLQLTR